MRKLLFVALLVTLLAVADTLGLWRADLAHPFWSLQGALVGGTLGALAGLGIGHALGAARRWPIGAGGVVTLLFGAATFYGKAIFAASYAENALAGQVWFLGYHATMAALAFTLFYIVLALSELPRKHD